MELKELLNKNLTGWSLTEAISIIYSDEDGDIDRKSEEFFKIVDEAYAEELSKKPRAKMEKVLIMTDGLNVLKLASQSIVQFVSDQDMRTRIKSDALGKLSKIEINVLGLGL